MKKSIFYVLGFIFMFFITSNVDAASNDMSISLTCPSSANPQATITCVVYATVTGNGATLKNVNVTYNSLINSATTSIESGTKIAVGGPIRLGTITAKTGSQGGTGTIKISMDAKFSDGSPTSKENITKTKEISIAKVLSSANTLNSISLDGKSIAHFNKNTTNYSVSTEKSSVLLSATKTSSKATVSGIGTKSLKCGSNSYVITVKAENGSTKKYTVTINRKCNSSANLKGITISSGTLSPIFKEDVYKYTVKLDKDVEKITIKGIKSDTNQKITGEVENKKIDYGTTTVNLVVTSQTGATKTYSITIDKSDTRDNNSLLSALSLSSGNISFDPNTFEYETKVLYEITKIEVLAVPEKETSTVQVTGNENLEVGENLITINVKSEKGETSDYKIKVTRLKEGETLGKNANIKNIKVAGYDLPFEYDRKDYKLVINDEDQLDITVVMDDPSATYEIIGNENLKDGSIIKIVTKSQDGTSKTYTIEITKPSYLIYFIIGGALIALAIAIPVIVYFKSVKKKKELLDVNGYKVGKGYNDQENSRKIIRTSPNPETNQIQNNNQIQITDNPITNNEQINNQNPNEQDFDAGLQNYIPSDSKNKCPACGRELLGSPNECPYCKTKLK